MSALDRYVTNINGIYITNINFRPVFSVFAEVARTRLREEGSRYRSFFQTLWTVCMEEGYRGMYRGLVTQLIRQIPNTAIMMSTYEAVVYLLSGSTFDDDDDDDV